MISATIALALAAAFFFGTALALTQLGLRDLSPLSGAAISIPSSALLFLCSAPYVFGHGVVWSAVPIFAAVGLLFPAAVTLLTFESNRTLGPVIAGSLGNLAPLFAIVIAVVVLGETPRLVQVGGLVVIVAGVVTLSGARANDDGHWRSWHLALPLLAAAIRGIVQPTIKLGLEIWPSPFAAALIGYIVSSVVVVVAARLRTGRWLAHASMRGRLWFLAVGLCNGLAVLLMYAALARGSVTLVAPLVATYPLVTMLLSAWLFGQLELSPKRIGGATLTVVGVVLLLAG
jgi:drug/metabolite transporter (DMT)-like permease